MGDAQFVEVFHSNGGQLGFFTRIGDADFYINKGKTQPECEGNANTNSCSHYRAVTVYNRLVSRQNNYVVITCESVEQVAEGCSNDPIEIKLEELNPSGIYQINTLNAEANKQSVNKDVEII